MHLIASAPHDYLAADAVVEADAEPVRALAAQLRAEHGDDVAFTRAAFEWVRDEVAHSWDAKDPRVTCTATEVLTERVGLCYAKSHLLAAVLRAEGVPTGLCYQILTDATAAPVPEDEYMVHGLVAVHLDGGWHRLDPRGNKPGVDARFSLDEEHLAWPVRPELGEQDLPEVHVVPHPVVLAALASADDVLELCGRLPGSLSV